VPVTAGQAVSNDGGWARRVVDLVQVRPAAPSAHAARRPSRSALTAAGVQLQVRELGRWVEVPEQLKETGNPDQWQQPHAIASLEGGDCPIDRRPRMRRG
jgi:hypothetical protein